ncbi:MAG: glutamate synthase subunit beta [Candidatus Avoscillospira sp.]
MGKPTGFMEYTRQVNPALEPLVRIEHYQEFHSRLSLEERQEQGARCMNCGVPFCQSGMEFEGKVYGCPLHNLIPEWNDMTYKGNPSHALSRLLKTNNFPEFTGRVCPALCEKACVCGLHGQPVTVRENELEIIEQGFAEGLVKPRIPAARSDKTVAIVGSGPAGLAAADLLNRRGHTVTVFERDDRLGGLLMYGIPNMKLDKSVILRRIDLMAREGVRFRVGVNVNTPEAARQLLDQFDCVLLCCGAGKPRPLEQAGDLPGVSYALPYLKAATRSLMNLHEENPLSAAGKHVVVVGAGDTSADCVATAIRQGAASVTQLIRKPRAAVEQSKNLWGVEIPFRDYAEEEAVAKFGQSPRRYETVVESVQADGEGKLCAVTTAKTCWEGRKMRVLEGSGETIPADLLLIASGFSGCEEAVCQSFGVEMSRRGTAATAPDGHATNVPRVFTAGDMRRGPSLVVWAIAEGRTAAREVDEYLMGYTNL